MSEKKRDWSKLGTVEGMGEWLRSQSGAICVLVIRPHDSVFLLDPDCAPKDAGELVAEYLPRLISGVDYARKERGRIRLEHGPCPE
jgi:hypothetical protein